MERCLRHVKLKGWRNWGGSLSTAINVRGQDSEIPHHGGYLFCKRLFIHYIYSAKVICDAIYSRYVFCKAPSSSEPSSEVEKQISIFTEGKTPEGTEPLFTGLKLTAYHLQAITLPIGGKQELSWIFNLF